jgi:hypothetical protein
MSRQLLFQIIRPVNRKVKNILLHIFIGQLYLSFTYVYVINTTVISLGLQRRINAMSHISLLPSLFFFFSLEVLIYSYSSIGIVWQLDTSINDRVIIFFRFNLHTYM